MPSLYDDASLIMYPSGYKSGKIYCQKPTDGSGDLTFSRASTATRVNSSGLIESVASNVPRIDYTGGGCGKLLLEPQRTNLVTYSEDFSNAQWVKSGVSIVSNDATSPDGSTTATKIIEDSSTGFHEIEDEAIVVTTIANYSTTIYVKAGTRNWVRVSSDNGGYAYFKLSDATIGITLNATATATAMANGWVKCTITFSPTSGTGSVSIRLATGDGVTSYTGDGTSYVHAWGAQLELGFYPTSIIPTAGSTVTRLVDVPSLSGLTTNGIIGATQGTFYMYIKNIKVGGTSTFPLLAIGDNSSNNIYCFYLIGGDVQIFVRQGGSTITSYDPNLLTMKVAFQLSASGIKIFVNGAMVNSSATAYNGSITQLQGVTQMGGEIQEMYMSNIALSDAECINLTTI